MLAGHWGGRIEGRMDKNQPNTMNREIKFRAWDKTQNKMFIVAFFGTTKYAKNQICVQGFNGEEKSIGWYYNEDIEIMQFTGLKDKNGKGKEVYDRDLIRSLPCGYEPRDIFEVVWDENKLRWGVKDKHGELTPLWSFTKDFEVIGNIHENPNLLK